MASAGQADPDARARLVREAQAAALLRSPHIAVTYDLVEQGKSIFIAMEYVEGELLSARIGRGPIPLGDSLDIALQVADALDEAHGHGIIHRDIKSSNLILTPRQLVKVLDFGLAKFLSAPKPDELRTLAGVTTPGAVLGTLSYMSPEQLTGAVVDHRADLFATGVVLYEMIAGRLPFTGNSMTDIADHILHQEPEAIARYNYGVSPDVEAILRKALEKQPDFRYQSARELYIDLANARRRLSSGDAAQRRSMVWRGPIEFSDPAAPMPLLPSRADSALSGVPVVDGQRSIAVLTFANITGNPSDDWIGQGIAETLTADLKKVKGLAVLPREQIFDQLRNVTAVGHGLDERQAIDVGRRLSAWWVLTGGYQHLGDRIRITAYVIEVLSGRLADTVKLDGTMEQIFELQDEVVIEIAKSLDLSVGSSEVAAITEGETKSVEAYESYSRAMLNLRLAGRESFERAITLFERAIELDPGYAEAIAGLGAAYQLKASFLSLPALNAVAIMLLRKAVEIKPTMMEAKTRLAMGLMADGDTDGAIQLLEDVVREQPDNAMAHGTLGRAYWMGKGRVDDAIRELEESVAINPESGYAYLQLALLYALLNRLDEAERAASSATELQEQAMSGTQGLLVVGAHARLGYVHYLRGQYDAAIAEYRRELDFLSASDHALRDRAIIEVEQKLGAAHSRKGDEDAAEVHNRRALEAFSARLASGADDPFTRYYVATLFAVRGDAPAARRHLDRPLAELGPLTRWRLAHDADFEVVRGLEAFADVGIDPATERTISPATTDR
ncbi:MAG: protein kinase [Acidobacteria bacterium]|nr:protein kinase [Acidobacteriota bacterium]